jgi:hypothetical protein
MELTEYRSLILYADDIRVNLFELAGKRPPVLPIAAAILWVMEAVLCSTSILDCRRIICESRTQYRDARSRPHRYEMIREAQRHCGDMAVG